MRCTRHRAQTEIRARGSQRPYFNSWHQTPSLRCCGDRYPNLLQSELAVSLILPEALGREWCVRYLLTSPASPAGVVGAALRTPRPRLASRSRTRRRCAPDRTSSGARHRARPSSAPCRCSPARTVPRLAGVRAASELRGRGESPIVARQPLTPRKDWPSKMRQSITSRASSKSIVLWQTRKSLPASLP